MLQMIMVPSVLVWTSVLRREFQKWHLLLIIWCICYYSSWVLSSEEGVGGEHVTCRSSVAVAVLSFPPSPPCCHVTTAFLFIPGHSIWGSFLSAPCCCFWESSFEPLERDHGGVLNLQDLSVSLSVCLSSHWYKLDSFGSKFNWWLDLMSSVFPNTISFYSRGSFLRQVRCKPRLMFEFREVKGFVHGAKANGQWNWVSKPGPSPTLKTLQREEVKGSDSWPHMPVLQSAHPFPHFFFAPLRKHFKADTRHHVIGCTALCSGAHVSLRSKAGEWGRVCRVNGEKTYFCQSWFDNWLIKFRWNNDWRVPTLG